MINTKIKAYVVVFIGYVVKVALNFSGKLFYQIFLAAEPKKETTKRLRQISIATIIQLKNQLSL